MDEIHANYLRDHHGYETWRTPDDEGAPVVSGFTPGPEQMPGWQPVRVDPVPFEGARSATQSIWRPVQGEGALLRLDLIEVTSSGHARAMLLRLLGEFQSPELRRREGIGDVAFEMPGSSCILFARRNVVVMLRNAGHEVVGLEAPARELDQALREAGREEN